GSRRPTADRLMDRRRRRWPLPALHYRGPPVQPVRPRLVLAICCLSIFIVSLDNTIVNVALPSIRRDLHASITDLQWTIDAYTIVLAGLLMVSGSTADRLGRARIFRVGLLLFSTGSLLCSVAWSPAALIA